MDLSNKIVRHFKREHPNQIEEDIAKLTVTHGKMVDILSIQKVGTFWFCWYRLEIQAQPINKEAADGKPTHSVRRSRKAKI